MFSRNNKSPVNGENYNVTTKPKTMKNSTTLLAFVEDPDGYKIELIERD